LTAMSPELAREQSESADALLAIVRLICEELHALAFDMTELGESLSGEDKATYKLQVFDLFGQRLLAQAQLLHGIEQLFSCPTSDWRGSTEAIIQAVPFHGQRRRLTAALNGQRVDLSDSSAGEGGGPDWF
jgi:hypothetical protein